MVGSAIVRRLAAEDVEVVTANRQEVDLRRQADVEAFMQAERPDIVILAAAKVGGIEANSTLPADFLYDNLVIETSVIEASRLANVRKLLFLGSTCVYPKLAPQPMAEDSLLTGPLEPTNEWYAVAKIAGIKLCQAYRRQYGSDFIVAMPTNLYGINDNYDPKSSHVPAALIHRMHHAKLSGDSDVVVWGSGTPRREFLSSDDLADACTFLLQNYSDAVPVNVGVGTDMSIAEFATLVAEVVGFDGKIVFDTTKADGTPRKLVDTARMDALGWRAKTPLREGLVMAYQDYLSRLT